MSDKTEASACAKRDALVQDAGWNLCDPTGQTGGQHLESVHSFGANPRT